MRHRPNVKFCLPFTLCCVLLGATVWKTGAQTPASAAELQVGGAVTAPLKLSSDDLKKMPRVTLGVINPHTQKKETYEGVRVEDLLRKAGVPLDEKMRGPVVASYVIAEAEDGYRAVFSLAELDSGMVDSEVIVADTMDGLPLGEKAGPFRIVVCHEKRPARWVRMLRSLTVVTLPSNPTNKP